MDSGSYTFASNLFVHSYISTFTATALETTAGLYPATYEFSVTPKARVPEGAYLILELPTEVEVPDRSKVVRNCFN